MGIMDSSGEICGEGNAFNCMDQKNPKLTSLTATFNNMWENAYVGMIVDKEEIIKETGRANAPLECWGCTNTPRNHETGSKNIRTDPTRRTQTMGDV